MDALGLTPILNVSSLIDSFAWFEKLGWRKLWAYEEEPGMDPGFGAVGSQGCEIFLCRDCQGGKGRSPVQATFGEGGDTTGDKGVWMSIWVDDVDAVYQECLKSGVEIAFPPTDMPWNVREMHVRHPDGHVFRIGKGIPEEGEGGQEYDMASDIRAKGPLLPIERVDVPLRLEKRIAAVVRDLAELKHMDLNSMMEETLLHTFEKFGGGVASPHTEKHLVEIQKLKKKHGIDYDCHASYRFEERPAR